MIIIFPWVTHIPARREKKETAVVDRGTARNEEI